MHFTVSKIYIQPNKHLGLVFRPRSGSHILRHYLSDLAERINIGEWVNHRVESYDVRIRSGEVLVAPRGKPTTLQDQQLLQRSLSNIELLDQLSELNVYTVFGVLTQSYMYKYPHLSTRLASRPDIQLIRVERADVLYSLISTEVAKASSMWHNMNETGSTLLRRSVDNFKMNGLERALQMYIQEQDEIMKSFGNLQTIYYEQFQHTPAALRHLFSGIPQRIVSFPFNKFVGNHKGLISNLEEVEDCYEQFVNDHKEYFPQYFGKLPEITIPVCQGRQPRNLSLREAA